jgi:hypothetical protein
MVQVGFTQVLSSTVDCVGLEFLACNFLELAALDRSDELNPKHGRQKSWHQEWIHIGARLCQDC